MGVLIEFKVLDGKLSYDGVHVDFNGIEMRLVRSSSRNTNQPLLKAVGKKCQTILDLTCGYGKDSYLFLCTGKKVIGVERNPTVYRLLEDGVSRARQSVENSELFQRFELNHEEAETHLMNIKGAPDVIYLDPMYPPRNSSALPKKDIQLLRRLLNKELVEEESKRTEILKSLINRSLSVAEQRVVLKRPIWSPEILKPKVSFKGKLARYDVYIRA